LTNVSETQTTQNKAMALWRSDWTALQCYSHIIRF
jgi:hypothetical protein